MKAADLRKYEGQALKLTFANGVQVCTTIRAVLPDAGEPQLVICNGADISGRDGEGLGNPFGFAFVPVGIARVKEMWRKTDPRLAQGKQPQEFDFEE